MTDGNGVVIRHEDPDAFPPVKPSDLGEWVVVSGATTDAAGQGLRYLVHDPQGWTNSRMEEDKPVPYLRAYLFFETIHPQIKQVRGVAVLEGWDVQRFACPIGMQSGKLGVVLRVVEQTPLNDLDAAGREQYAGLINGADEMRKAAKAAAAGAVLDLSAAGRGGGFQHPGDGQRGSRRS